jgi:hypothetical protein
MKLRHWWLGCWLVCLLVGSVWAAETYSYSFPKPSADWGQAVSFGNLSPGFFQVMYQSKTGVVRIATYGIVGASMDNLKDPQLMMVFAFDQKAGAARTGRYEKLANK